MSTAAVRICRQCGDQLVAADRFCATCGTRVERSCIQCSTMLVSGDRFCPECGTPQEPTGPVSATPSGFTSVWDSVVRVLRSSLSGDYRITRELGRGGQAAVFQADELALNRQVAIKVLAPGVVNGERDVELFRREAQTIANLTHPHIVTVYSVRQVDDLHLFVMQYIEGRSLAAIIAERGPLPLTTVRAVAFQVGNALQYAHKRGVIHRDIKPANVLFDEDGNAIVTDFGIAKDITKGTSSTLTGGLLGTPAYMSPEQCNQLPVTWASDQYSMGVMLYEMLTGRVPFDGSAFMVMQGHTDREPPSIRTLRPDCPVELEWAVLRMLAKRSGERFATFSDALEGLGATPLTRDDPIRGELKRLALGAATASPARPVSGGRLTLSMPEQVEVGEPAAWDLYLVAPGESESLRVTGTLRVSDSAVARYDEATGALVGVTPGRVTVTAESEHGQATAEVEVIDARVASVTLTAPATQLEVGQTQRCTADVRDRRGAPMSLPVTWESSTPSVLSVTREGVLRALTPGAARIVARSGEANDERAFVVLAAAAASIVVSPPPMQVEVNESFVLSAQVLDSQGEPLAGYAPQWSSSDEQVADIDAFGVVSAHAPGHVQFVARSGSAEARVALVVRAGSSVAASDMGINGGEGPNAAPAFEPYAAEAISGNVSETRSAKPAAISSDERWDAEGLEEVPTPRRSRSWAMGAGAIAIVGLATALFLKGRADGDRVDADPGMSATVLSRFPVAIAGALDSLGYTLEGPSFIDGFDAEPDGRRTVQDSAYRSPSWVPLEAGGMAVHAVLREPLASTRSAAIVIQTSDRATYFLELLNEPKSTGLRLLRQRDGKREELFVVPALPSRWVGPLSLDAVWAGPALRLYVDGVPVAAPIAIDQPPKVRVLLYGRGGAVFDELTAVTLRSR